MSLLTLGGFLLTCECLAGLVLVDAQRCFAVEPIYLSTIHVCVVRQINT